jgi:hypothetical protein
MRIGRGVWKLFTVAAFAVASSATVVAQEATTDAQQPEAGTRAGIIQQEEEAKVKTLHPYEPGAAEKWMDKAEDILVSGGLRWHPFFQSAYSGGGFTLGAGYRRFVSSYNTLDVRGSWTITNYKRIEAEFVAPHLFNRHGSLSLLGGWREATQVGFYGIGTDTSKDNRTNYLFNEPYGSALLTLWPTRSLLMLRGGVELARWRQEPGKGTFPSVETKYTPETLPGLGAEATYVHSQGTVGIDSRTSPGYTRRGGFYGVTVHDYTDNDKEFGFQQVDYEVIQHLPLLREAWVISLHGLAETSFNKSNQQTPFFMLPSVGGGSSLRGYPSWRFRDNNSLLLQAEWRIMVNRFIDTAVFYDTGKVTARTADLDFKGLKSDYGFGLRFHGPISTPLRVEIAHGKEGLSFIFAASPAF